MKGMKELKVSPREWPSLSKPFSKQLSQRMSCQTQRKAKKPTMEWGRGNTETISRTERQVQVCAFLQAM